MLVKVTNRSESPGYVFNTQGHQVDCPPGVSVEVDMTPNDVTHLLHKNGRMAIEEIEPAALDSAPSAVVSDNSVAGAQAAGDDAEIGDTDAAMAEVLAEQQATEDTKLEDEFNKAKQPVELVAPKPVGTVEPVGPEAKNKFAKRPKAR